MESGSGSQKKASTLNPDAPVFQPSSASLATVLATVDLPNWNAENYMSECPDYLPMLPSSLDVTTEDLVANLEYLNDDLEDLPSEWNVDDFSPEWWNLVHTSPSFREYWMQRYEIEEDYFNQACLLEGGDDMQLPCKNIVEEEQATVTPSSTGSDARDLVQMVKSMQLSTRELPSRYHNKIPQVSPKRVTARKIQQPR